MLKVRPHPLFHLFHILLIYHICLKVAFPCNIVSNKTLYNMRCASCGMADKAQSYQSD